MIEVVVALTLIILFLSGVVIVELYAVKNADFARNKSNSTRLARQQLERARVIRDSVGIAVLTECQLEKCFINNLLTPIPLPLVTPTGFYRQSLSITQDLVDCPLPTVVQGPAAVSYKATALVSWAVGVADITPAPEVEVSSCITDWR